MRLLRPMPPTPTQAMLSRSLGGTKPRPRTCLGTIVSAAPAMVAFSIKLRLDISLSLRGLMKVPPNLGHYGAEDEALRQESWGISIFLRVEEGELESLRRR